MINDGGPAFPRPYSKDETSGDYARGEYAQVGVSAREYFAAKAIDRCIDIAAQFVMDQDDFEPGQVMLSEVARRGVAMAFHVADAMLAERNKS